ncbi:NADH-quinone oxidoreductase subunit J family protein [Desulfurivibrio dismutans]|uniref:NADH-quinone oxidoreductase subunit J family protein n=1 Tax=Desulfurivibrio dismutans TaxID=1398908 RepID=UPI0023DAFACE|nr:NADH-quinone oxidoreductase subunit J [Desulfurivibrio alkaliphilus]MDF1614021.1 NADH-quinone oxidoreductase subunit J [Desulfurivibrio alkaliphilus]
MTPLLTVEGLAGVVFFGFILLIIFGALVATNAVNLIRAVCGLALCLVGVAGIYYFLQSPFLALMQILIYAGAVCVAIVFAVMLAEPQGVQRLERAHPLAGPGAFAVAALMTWGLAALALRTSWPEAAARVNAGALEDVGRAMMTTFVVSFELISLILLVAILGSLVLARRGRRR